VWRIIINNSRGKGLVFVHFFGFFLGFYFLGVQIACCGVILLAILSFLYREASVSEVGDYVGICC
jgi:hypothetical protein